MSQVRLLPLVPLDVVTKGTKSSRRLSQAGDSAPTGQPLTPPSGPPRAFIHFRFLSNHAKVPTEHKFYQGAANRGLINAAFWGSVGGFLITNAVRLLH